MSNAGKQGRGAQGAVDQPVALGALGAELDPADGSHLLREMAVRRRVERQLFESRQRLQAIIDSRFAFVVLCSTDGSIEEINRAPEDCTVTNRDELLGTHLADGPWWGARTGRGQPVREALASAKQGQRVRLDLAFLSGSGRELFLDTTFVPLLDERGGVDRIVVSGVDVTERHRMEAALRKSESGLREAQRIARLGNWDWNLELDELSWSDEVYRLFGLPVRPDARLDHQSFMQAVHVDDRPKVEAAVSKALERGAPYELDFRAVRPDGGELIVHQQAEVLRDSHGFPVRLIGTVQDVTAERYADAERAQLLKSERQARADAERASKAKDTFLALISHELRTPLSAVLMRVQLLRRGEPLPPRLETALAKIEESAWTQKQLIDDLLDVSSMLVGKLSLDKAEVELGAVLRDSVEALAEQAKRKGVTLLLNEPPASFSVLGDRIRLQQIFWNLLNNAIKFTNPGGKVEAMLEPAGPTGGREGVRVRVVDTGEGFPPDFLPHIFDAFTQADASWTRQHGGMGLGLAISRSLVELHGGRIQAFSGGTGRGAEFTVELPCIEAVAPKPLDRPELDGLSLEGRQILLVDDDGPSREALTELLDSLGAEVRAAPSVAEAMEALERWRPEVIVCDLAMPGEDGFALLRRLEGAGFSSLPVIALTAFVDAGRRAQTLAAGFCAHLQKPVDLRELTAEITRRRTAGVPPPPSSH